MGEKVTIKCSGCNKQIDINPYRLKTNKNNFCSKACFFDNQKITLAPQKKVFETRKCFICDSDVTRKPSEFKRSSNCFCSRNCYTEHVRIRNAEIKASNTHNCDMCGKEFHIKPTSKSKRKSACCSRKCAGELQSLNVVQENHPRWDKDKSNDERIINRKYLDYINWRRQVYERDGYSCLCCKDKSGGNLNAHHLDGFNWCVEKRTDVGNGVTLCNKCHTDFHRVYGYGDNTHEQYDEWIRNKRKQGA